ncbi:MAG TPA: hypothetical protein VFJ61_10015 [Solirubrobacterales bacterium]|nr:hypothetical protein [Solirubrobacterales bacterium]
MRTPGKNTILLLLLALVALAIAGCGGGGDETETTAEATIEEPRQLTKAELIEQGDGICAEVNAAVGALGAETEESAVPETIEKTANLYTGMVERLQELGAPEGDSGDYAKVMEAAEELAKVEGEVKLAAEREDTEALGEAATEATPALEEFETQATIYGFKDCGEGPSAPTAATPGGESGEAGEEFGGVEEEGGVEAEPEYVEPEEEAPPVEEAAPETGGAGGGAEVAPEAAPETGGGSESGGVGPG